MKTTRKRLLFIFLPLILGACQLGSLPTQPDVTVTPSLTRTPTLTSTPSQTATVTPVLVTLDATVWTADPIVPILTFHQFKTDGETPSDFKGGKLQLSDFLVALQALYDGGYSLVSLEGWLAGDMVVPAGRRPLIFTMDDMFYTNQILLDENGSLVSDTGIGALWHFSQAHPDFGFHISLFIVLGDKYFPFDPQYSDEPRYQGRNWETELAQTIVWCIEHGAGIYNHTYRHGYLGAVPSPVSIKTYLEQLTRNDVYLRQLLVKVGREDLIPRLGNMIALTGGIPPQSESDWRKLRAYKNPEGVLVRAIFGIYSPAAGPLDWQYLLPSFTPDFDPYRIIRIVANMPNMQFLVDNTANFPSAQTCPILLEETMQDDEAYRREQIQTTINRGVCPPGLYILDGNLYRASASGVHPITIP